MKKTYKRRSGDPITPEQERQIEKLLKMPDNEIDYSDIPPLHGEIPHRAERGHLYRPIKKAVSLRLDADIIEWLKKDGEGYQTRANQLLRERMLKDLTTH